MRDYLRRCRFFFAYVGIFTFFINLFFLATPIYWLQVFDRVLNSRSLSTLAMLTIVVLWAMLFSHLLEVLRGNLLARAGTALDDFLAAPVLKRQLDTANKPMTQLAEDSLADVNKLRGFLSGPTVVAMFELPWGILFLIIMFLFHPILGGATLLAAILLGMLALHEARGTLPGLEEAAVAQRRSARFVQSAMRNAEAVGAMGMSAALSRRWEAVNGKLKGLQLEASNDIGLAAAIGRFLRAATRIALLCVASYLIIKDQMSPGIMLAATMIADRALGPIESVIRNWRNFSTVRIAYLRLARLLEEGKEETEKLELPEPEGRLELDRMFFRFGQTEPLLRNLSFVLQPGESLAVIGPSGSGKTTLLRLVSGLWIPSSGTVRLDNADVFAWDKDHLGRYLGYLPQDVELFEGTVAENICRLGDIEESNEQIIAAARLAQAHEMILHLPLGYDTPLGEGGVRLSGGQKQRIALARALFGTPKLVILDEPNSNLDAEGEEALMRVLRDLRKAGVTIVAVTHKLALLNAFDKTLLLKKDGTYQIGRTAEVIARNQGANGAQAAAKPAPPKPVDAAAAFQAMKSRGQVERIDDKIVFGWVLFQARPELVPVIQLHIDDELVATTEANLFRHDLAANSIGTGYHGFKFAMPADRDLGPDPAARVKVYVVVPGVGPALLPKA